jgi:hypothetical protein
MSFAANIVLASCAVCLCATRLWAQGTITFDGPPIQPPRTASVVQSYGESGVWFAPIPGTAGFIRRGSNPPLAGWPDNGSSYILAALGESLMFGLDDGATFRLVSVDLAEFSTLYAEPLVVRFIGYRADGSGVTNDLVTDGIIDGTGPLEDFQNLSFGPEFSDLVQVRIPTSLWTMDNLRLSIPEPTTVSLGVCGLVLWRLFRKRLQGASLR